ncbi:hypothetical protein CDL15_Pgr027025 [Punica granatum]|uniref:Uncharacterized protein n=1 Tax=Punica granatum TaxID=22663 RepID=A0A218WEV4_PUNGR|nr:hypothetical protein CDL15_Pgr027025 [Punica granatum]
MTPVDVVVQILNNQLSSLMWIDDKVEEFSSRIQKLVGQGSAVEHGCPELRYSVPFLASFYSSTQLDNSSSSSAAVSAFRSSSDSTLHSSSSATEGGREDGTPLSREDYNQRSLIQTSTSPTAKVEKLQMSRELELETSLIVAEQKNVELEEQISSLEGLMEANMKLTEELASYESKFNDLQANIFTAKQREAVVEGSFSKKLREASYCALSGAMTMSSIIIGLKATVAEWNAMAEASFSEFIGAVLAFAIGELLMAWSEKKTTEALLKLAKASREATEEMVESW